MASPCSDDGCFHLPPHDRSAHDQVVTTTRGFGGDFASTPPSTVGEALFEHLFNFPEDEHHSAGEASTIQQAGYTFPFRPSGLSVANGNETRAAMMSDACIPTSDGGAGSSNNNNTAISNFNSSSAAANVMLNPLNTSFNSTQGSTQLSDAGSPAAQGSLLRHSVDSSQYENVSDDDWLLSITEHDETGSTASADSQSIGPTTPHSSAASSSFSSSFRNSFLQSSLAEPVPAAHDAQSKYESEPHLSSSFSSTSSSSSFASRHQLSVAASFGAMTLPSTFSQAGMWPATSAMVPGPYMGHSHPFGISGTCLPIPQPTHVPYPVQSFSQITNQHPIFEPATSFEDLEQEESSEGSPQPTESEADSALESDLNCNDSAVTEARVRHERDKFLIKMRNQGYSYKEIKRIGKFTEAESTLRGRVRVLTKPKDQRVRSPEWTEVDMALLQKAFRRFATTTGRGRSIDSDTNTRPPWKRISEYMVKHGASYDFAPATCARKWKEMQP